MLDAIKILLLDYLESPLETGISRRLHAEPLRGKATVCIGARRCGKSTYLCQLIQRLLDSGVLPQNILYLNFFDDRLYSLRHESLALITEAYYSLYTEKKGEETTNRIVPFRLLTRRGEQRTFFAVYVDTSVNGNRMGPVRDRIWGILLAVAESTA